MIYFIGDYWGIVVMLCHGGVPVWTAAVVHVWIFRSSSAVVLPLLAVVVLVPITVVVEPAVLVSGAVGEEMTLRVVLTDGLTV